MKNTGIFSFLLVAFVLAGCPGENQSPVYLSDLEKLQKNNMDFPDLRPQYFNGVRFKLSDLFRRTYYDQFVLSDNYDIRVINELSLYFSIESFSLSDAESIKYNFENEEISLMDAVHDNYIIKRNASLEEATISIKKAAPKSVGYPCMMQTISGVYDYDDLANTYFLATLDLEDQIVVVQLIGKKENMGYLYDDFIDILSSISL